jgi:hypothetical protein
VGDIIVFPFSFLPGQSFSLGGANPPAVAVADFNGDGKPDVVTGGYNSGTIFVLLQR